MKQRGQARSLIGTGVLRITKGIKMRRSITLALATLFLIAVPAAASAAGSNGALIQKPAPDACISETGTGGDCTNGVGLDGAYSVTFSPDGKSAYVASQNSDAVAVFDRNTTTGALTQKSGTEACISETGTGGACADGVGLIGAISVSVSPDGKSAYVASSLSNAVAVFDRNATTGALTQKSGTEACISETGTGGACADGVGLDYAYSVAISPDGKSAYVASIMSDAVAAFDRNTTTGALTQKSGTEACISETGTGGACADGVGLINAISVTISPDGKSAYVASFGSSAVAVFDRNTTTGALTQKSGTEACVSETGTGGACTDGVGLDGANLITVSPDGKSAYVSSYLSSAVAVFDRNSTTGTLTQKSGTEACFSETGTGGACADGVGLDSASSVTISPDGKSAYIASFGSSAVAAFDRNTTTGALTQKSGTEACVSETGTGGACTDGVGLDGPYSVTISPDGKSAYVASFSSSAVAMFDRLLLSSADINPVSLTFGDPTPVPQGTVSPPQAVTITNNGSAPLKVRGFEFGGTNPDDFFIGSDTCRDMVDQDQSCVIRVRFAPQAGGARSATLIALTNAPTDPTVSLSGIAGPLPTGATGDQGATGETGVTGPSGPTGPIGPGFDSSSARFSKLTNRTIKVPPSRLIKVVRVSCRGGECRIRRATAIFRVGGAAFSGRAIFQASTFASGSSAVVSVKVPKRVYRRLSTRKSGTISVSLLATSSNGTRNQNTLRNGLRR